MVHLVLPHFCIGLGIGIVDAALMPLLARLVERHGLADGYGAVYALSQTAVCLAYSVGKFITTSPSGPLILLCLYVQKKWLNVLCFPTYACAINFIRY